MGKDSGGYGDSKADSQGSKNRDLEKKIKEMDKKCTRMETLIHNHINENSCPCSSGEIYCYLHEALEL